jgi:hypothetical protein
MSVRAHRTIAVHASWLDNARGKTAPAQTFFASSLSKEIFLPVYFPAISKARA